VASDGDRFIVVWRNRKSPSTALSAAIVGADGTVGKQTLLPAPFRAMKYSQHVVTWDGSTFVVAYSVCPGRPDDCRSNRDWAVNLIRVAADGTVLDGHPVVVDAAERHPSISAGPNGALLVYDRFAADAHSGGVVRVFARLVQG
jgi:hypothetical protein